jgi:prepilin-type N-terminal cleavage/methylation domain-containing protein
MNHKAKGFTLIELLITISIVVVLSAMFIPNYQKFKIYLSLERSAVKLAQDVKAAQEMALSATECPLAVCGPIGAPKTGYGIYFDKSWDVAKYRLYADTLNNNEIFDGDAILETIELEDKIYIDDIKDDSNNSIAKVSINFKPPDPEVKIQSGASDLNNTTIKLCVQGTDCGDAKNIRTIKINTAGLIFVE